MVRQTPMVIGTYGEADTTKGGSMDLHGMHHITMVTGDAQANVDFYADVLGLRLVKQTVNFDAPDMYHLYYGDDDASPGALLTWFEIRGARPGRAGAGMVHRIELGVPSHASLDWWQQRLADTGYAADRQDTVLTFGDYDGLGLSLVVASSGNEPLTASHAAIPAAHAIVGVERVRAYEPAGPDGTVSSVRDAEALTEVLGFEQLSSPGAFRAAGERRQLEWVYDPAPDAPGMPGAGTVHHIAWCSLDDDHAQWQQHIADAGFNVTPVVDRDYFKALYFRMPGGVLFEIATVSPGFATDEDPDHLGETLQVPDQHAMLERHIRETLTPLKLPQVPA